MEYLNATKIHGVISPALHNEIASSSSLNDISMSPELLQINGYKKAILSTSW